MATKIESYLPIFPGFYSTIFEADEDYIIESPFSYEDYTFNYTDYSIDMSRACVNGVSEKLNELGFNMLIEYQTTNSPKEYNFYNDSINVVYHLKSGCIKSIKDYLHNNSELFAQFLRGRYTTCSGFISSHSNDLNEWISYVTIAGLQSNGHYLGSVLEFILLNEDYNTEDLYYSCEGVYLDGWLTNGNALYESVIEDYEGIEVLAYDTTNVLGRDKESGKAYFIYKANSDMTMNFDMFCEIGEIYKSWFTDELAKLNLKVMHNSIDVYDYFEPIIHNQLTLFIIS